MMIFVFDTVKNIVEKGENAGNQPFLLFPQCLQRAINPGWLQVGIMWYRVNAPAVNKLYSLALY